MRLPKPKLASTSQIDTEQASRSGLLILPEFQKSFDPTNALALFTTRRPWTACALDGAGRRDSSRRAHSEGCRALDAPLAGRPPCNNVEPSTISFGPWRSLNSASEAEVARVNECNGDFSSTTNQMLKVEMAEATHYSGNSESKRRWFPSVESGHGRTAGPKSNLRFGA